MKSERVNDGGPAFPVPSYQDNWGTTHHTATGLSLRDYLAAKAMPHLMDLELTSIWNQGRGAVGQRDYALQVAETSYLMADAMLRARKSSDE